MKKRVLLLLFFFWITLFVKAQTIKEQSLFFEDSWQPSDEMYDISPDFGYGLLNFRDLIVLVHIQDLDSIDTFLDKKGWKLEGTSEDRTTVTWSFEKNFYNPKLAMGWFFVTKRVGHDNYIAYRCASKENKYSILDDLLINTKIKKYYPTDIIERGLDRAFRDDKYEFDFIKQVKREDEDGANIQFQIDIYNYVQEEGNIIEDEENNNSKNVKGDDINWYIRK
ncbi:MAG: hypothetical protein J6W37_06700 [Bacteroidales bacterium]|nr:hypothetical protein [Bacteroidales bacterium]